MADVIWGTVLSIVDGNAFAINVTQWERNNKSQYSQNEQVRIRKIEVPEVPDDPGLRSKEILERNLKGKFVRCEIQERDAEGFLVSKVKAAALGGY